MSRRIIDLPVRYVAYARTTTNSRAEAAHAIENQLHPIRTLVDAFGGALVATFADQGESAFRYAECHGLEEAVALIEEGKADALASFDLTRLAPDVAAYQSILRRVKAGGGQVVFCYEGRE